jgi:hypothetical protein
MKSLLIDFGASNIKSVLYDGINFFDYSIRESPFLCSKSIHKKDLINILTSIVSIYDNKIDNIYICSILGGYYINDYYHSWQSNKIYDKNIKDCCMISGLFYGLPTFHMHSDHYRTSSKYKFIEDCSVLGFINNKPVYSSFGDTNCVIEAARSMIPDYGSIVNLGTGSQVIQIQNGREYNRYSYIPSGRALNVFQNFFLELGSDLFKLTKQISLQDILDSNININLNIFHQAHKFTISGGNINNIYENSFNVKNFTASIIRCYIDQYDEFLFTPYDKTIVLTGGIPRKIPIIIKYMQHKYKNANISHMSESIDETFIGIAKRIKKHANRENNHAAK